MFRPRPHLKGWDAKKLCKTKGKKDQRSLSSANNIISGNTCKVADGWFQADASSVVRPLPPIWRAGEVETPSLILFLFCRTHTFYRTISWADLCVLPWKWLFLFTCVINVPTIRLCWSRWIVIATVPLLAVHLPVWKKYYKLSIKNNFFTHHCL